MGKTAYFHSKITLGLLSVFFLSACEKKDSTNVTITFPNGNHIGAAKVTAASVGDNNWGAADPATIADINCYAVFVGGPNLGGKSCVAGSGSSFQSISFNLMKGFVTSGSTVQLEVPIGAGRAFYIVGARSIDGTCDTVDPNGNLNQSRYSNPLLVGSAQQDINPGDNTVDVNISLNTDLDTQKIKTCNFFGENLTPNTISLQGPINNYSNGVSKIGYNTCNMVYAGIRADNNHDGFVSVPFTMTLSMTPASLAQTYSDSACSTPTSTIDFLPGENFKPFYVRGTTFTVGTLAVSAPISSVGTLTGTFGVQVSSASSVQSFNFYRDHSLQAVGSCVEYPFYATDYNGVSTNIGTVTPVMYDIYGTNHTSLLNSGGTTGASRFQSSCDSTTNPTLVTGSQNYSTSSFTSLYFSLGNNWSDILVGVSTGSLGIFAGAAVNVTPVMNSVQLQGNPTPFVSDCSPIQLNGLNLMNATLGIADFSGTDSWGNPQIAKVNYYNMNNSNPANTYLDSACGTPDSSSNTTLTNATQIVNKYVTYGTIATYQFRAWAGPYAQNNESIMTINPKWDPALLKGTLGSGALLVWGRSQEADTSVAWNSRGTFLVNFPYSHFSLQNLNAIVGSPTTNSPDAELGGGTFKSVNFTGGAGQNLHQSGFNSANLYTAALVKLSAGSGDVMNIANGGGAPYMAVSLSSGTLNINSVPMGTTGVNIPGWNVVRVMVNNGSVSAAINNNSWTAAGTTSGTMGYFFLGGANSNPAFTGKVGEVMVMDGVPNSSDDTSIYNYFKAKFSNLNLP